nr:protein SHORT HYPOCOTYL IN WHITE LIGHT 1 [Ipomoea batatas]
MAGVAAVAAATSTLILTSPPSATPLSSLALPRVPPSPFTGLRSSALPRFHRTNPSLTICHAKFSGSIREEGEGIFGSSFGDEIMGEEEYESDDDEEDDDTESSIDLLIRFVRSIFKKVSKRARKATSSILPDIISPQLVISLKLLPSLLYMSSTCHL